MIRLASALLLALVAPLALAQAPAQATPQPAPAAVTDAIARNLSGLRAAAHLRRLTRIPDRPVLRQITCNAAATNTQQNSLLAKESQADGALFPISDPARLPPDLKRVAEYDDRAAGRSRRITRFSVAAFISPSEPSLTWVGIALYWGSFTETFARHFTRTYTSINPPVDIVPVCLSVK